MIDPIDIVLRAQSRLLVTLPPEFHIVSTAERRKISARLIDTLCANESEDKAGAFVQSLIRSGYLVQPRKPRAPAQLTAIKRIAVACCYFNPAGFKNRLRNYQRFAWGLRSQGVELHTIELVLDDDPPAIFGPNVRRLRGTRELNCLWQKERLLNLLISKMPPEIDGIVCADVDLVWHSADWIEQTRRSLEAFPVVHPYSYIHRWESAGDKCERRVGVGFALNNRLPYQQPWFAFPGYAWAARRSFWQRCGWFDLMITGSGDCALVAALLGDELPSDYAPRLAPVPRAMQREQEKWAKKVFADVGGNVGAIASEVSHCWHGSDRHRGYGERHRVLASLGFKLDDLAIDDAGLWAWRDPRSPLAKSMREFFANRQEDAT